MRIDAAVLETDLSAADVLQEERTNAFAIEIALRVVTDAGVGEEIREVVPQPELCIVAIGVLQSLDRGDRLDTLRERLEPIDALLETGEIGVRSLKAGLETRLYDQRERDDQCRKRAAAIEHGSAPRPISSSRLR